MSTHVLPLPQHTSTPSAIWHLSAASVDAVQQGNVSKERHTVHIYSTEAFGTGHLPPTTASPAAELQHWLLGGPVHLSAVEGVCTRGHDEASIFFRSLHVLNTNAWSDACPGLTTSAAHVVVATRAVDLLAAATSRRLGAAHTANAGGAEVCRVAMKDNRCLFWSKGRFRIV